MAVHSENGFALSGLGSMATRNLLSQLIEQYEGECGQRIDMISIGGVEAARRVATGEAFDFVVLASAALDRLSAAGHVEAIRSDIASSEMVVAIAEQGHLPDIRSEAALRDVLLQTSRIGYSTGPSGDHLLQLLQRWGVADRVIPRLVQAPPGIPVGHLIAQREVELGFQQLSELIHVPGIRVIGPLPEGARLVTLFSAAICTASERRDETARFLEFLRSAHLDAIKVACGMNPVS